MNNISITEEYLELFKEFIYNKSGIHFNLINQVILESRIESSMKERNIFNVGDYFHLISTDKQELKLFLDNITTNLTKFFRTESNFNLLKNKVLPIVLNNKKYSEPIYIWSSGCSTGEEPYSIAMTCLETSKIYPEKVKIYATDISRDAVGYTLSGLKAGETYEIQVVAVGTDENATEYAAAAFSVTTKSEDKNDNHGGNDNKNAATTDKNQNSTVNNANKAAKTGDTANVVFPAAVMMLAGAAVAGILFRRKWMK